jgi:hypothetical protein
MTRIRNQIVDAIPIKIKENFPKNDFFLLSNQFLKLFIGLLLKLLFPVFD